VTPPGPPVVRLVDVGDTRIALFTILFCLVAFFGTGNVASIGSFEISSTYRFTTVFQPFLMTFLLILKILLPIFLVAIICNIITRIINLPVMASFYITIILTNIMGFNFFFVDKRYWKLERNWYEYWTLYWNECIYCVLYFNFWNFADCVAEWNNFGETACGLICCGYFHKGGARII